MKIVGPSFQYVAQSLFRSLHGHYCASSVVDMGYTGLESLETVEVKCILPPCFSCRLPDLPILLILVD